MAWDWEKLKEQQKHQDNKPPQLDEIFDKFKNFKIPGGAFIIVIILLLGLFGKSMVFTIAVDEVGVIQRFGKYVRTEAPGLHFKLPIGIEKVTPVKFEKVEIEEFGFSARLDSRRDPFFPESDTNNVSLMLTGDLNVALVPWIVQYQRKSAYDYLFKVDNVNRFLRDMSEAAVRLVVGDRSINEVISKREEIATEAREVLQAELDKAESGIKILTVEMKSTNVPPKVQPYFNEVNQAVQEKEQIIYKAREDYNKAVPAARGEADRTIKEAEGYAVDRVNRAKGDAARFTALYNEYAKAKDVTKRRLYLEALNMVLPKLGRKYIIDEDQKNMLPLLNLGESEVK